MLLCLIVALPFIASVCAAFLPSRSRNAASWLAGSVALASTLLAAVLHRRIAGGEVVRFVASWAPQYGLEFNLRMDGFAWMFTMLVSGMGVLVVLYARYYMSAADPLPRFFAFLLAFMGSMLGVVLSGHLIQLVIFWELTSLSSFMLIAYWYHREDARRGARMSLIVTVSGGFALAGSAGARPDRRQLRPGRRARGGRRHSLESTLPTRAGAGAGRRLHQERAVSVSLLVAAGNGRAHAGVGLPALRNPGEGRGIPAHPSLARTVRHRSVVLAGVRSGRNHPVARRTFRHFPARHEGRAGVFHHQSPRAHHDAARHEQPARTGSG